MNQRTASTDVRSDLWSHLRQRAHQASARELAEAIGAPVQDIAWRLSRWASVGLIEVVAPVEATTCALRRADYVMVDACRAMVAPPALDAAGRPSAARAGREAMWRAMRVLRRFDMVNLRMAAEVSECSAKQYISCLLRAGILRREVRGHAASGARSIYALTGTFGPGTPVVRQRREGARRIQEVFVPIAGQDGGTVHPISPGRAAGPLF